MLVEGQRLLREFRHVTLVLQGTRPHQLSPECVFWADCLDLETACDILGPKSCNDDLLIKKSAEGICTPKPPGHGPSYTPDHAFWCHLISKTPFVSLLIFILSYLQV